MQKRWLKIVVALLIIIIFFIGGSYILKKMNTPDTPAFNHDFTKNFLVKDAETPEGFHLFESGTKKYTILFPENYYMSDGSYYKKTGNTSDVPDMENVFMREEGISPKQNKMIKGIKLALHPGGNVIVDTRVKGLLRKVNAANDTEINKFEDENKTVYYVENIEEYHAADGSIDTYFYFYGFITDNKSRQALYFELEDTCFNSDTKDCEIDFEKEKILGLEMMKSVEFK
jgi:hypothetical protein